MLWILWHVPPLNSEIVPQGGVERMNEVAGRSDGDGDDDDDDDDDAE